MWTAAASATLYDPNIIKAEQNVHTTLTGKVGRVQT